METNDKPTPGPWRVDLQARNTYGIRVADVIADMDIGPWCVAPNITNDADARLIAAAPALLDAASYAMRELANVDEDVTDVLAVLRGALAKATGVEVSS